MLGQVIFDLSEDLKPFLVDATQARGAWIADAERREMRAVAVEYLVSDCKEVATKIDVVLPSGENMVDLSDIKTTYQLDEDYLSWQLSIEKYFFEKQNPNLKVNRLLAFWYNKAKKEWQIREIQDKGTAEVERLLNAWRNGEYWGMPAIGSDVPTPVRSVAEFYAEIEYKIKEYTAQRDEFRSRLQALMEKHNVPQVKLEGFTCTYVGETERKGFDYKRLIEEHPEMWDGLLEEYQTTTRVKPSLKITLK